MKLGIVIPVLNEAPVLPALLQSLAEQPGIECAGCIAVVDGGSVDGSRDIANQWRDRLPGLRVVDNHRRITPFAFNLGIEACLAAGCDAVLITSAHSWLSNAFVARLLEVLALDEADVIGAATDYPPPRSSRDAAVHAFSDSRLGRGLERFRRAEAPVTTDVAFLPTIRARVFREIGLFDPAMVRNQDNDFTWRARRAGFRVVTYPSLRYVYSPRHNLRALCVQMRGNGYWVGFRPRVHSLRHFAPSLFWGGLVLVSVLAVLLGGQWWAAPAAWSAPYVAAVVTESLRWARRSGASLLLLPALFVAAHASYAAGTFSGMTALRGRS